MNPGRSLKVWIATAVIATIFVLSALPKLLGIELVREMFEEWKYPVELMYVVGLLELAGAFFILVPALARFGFGILMFVMCGAIITHLMAGEPAMVVIPLAMLVFLMVVAARDRAEQLPPRRRPHVPVTGT